MCPDPAPTSSPVSPVVPVSPVSPVVPEGLEVTGQLQYDAWWSKGWPPVEQVRPDVWSVPIPVPDNPIRYTLCYLLFGVGELVVVDPGWDTEPGWEALVAGLAAAGSSVEAVTGIAITHVHPDHHGMSARVVKAGGAWVAMHPVERDSLPRNAYPLGTVAEGDQLWLTQQGVPPDIGAELVMSDDGLETYRSMAEPGVVLQDGQYLPLAGRAIQAIWTPGHTPGHLCFHDQDNDLLLTGDHVLPRISPNVGLQPHTSAPPLQPYLDSLRRIATLDSAEVLPAHEWRFRGLDARTSQLLEHHQHRCEEILAVVGDLGPSSSWQVTEKLSWSRGWAAVRGFQRRAALSETIAHLAYLVDHGRLERSTGGDRPAAQAVPQELVYSLTR